MLSGKKERDNTGKFKQSAVSFIFKKSAAQIKLWAMFPEQNIILHIPGAVFGRQYISQYKKGRLGVVRITEVLLK